MTSPPRRFALLAACLLVAACASAPETKTTPRKKKHKKHDDDEVAEKHSKKKKASDDDSEKPDKPKKKTASASEDEETVTVDDDEEEASGAKAKKSKKKKEADEKAAEEKERKQREKEEKAEREKQKAEEKAREEKERKQREKEEKAEREKAKAEEEKEAKAKKKKKAEEDVAEDDGDGEKPKKKKKKNVEEVEEEPAEVDMTGDGDGDETKTAAKAKKGKIAAKAKPAKGKAAKAKKKTEEEEPAETSDETETAATEEPEPETPVADEKAKPSKGTKAKLAKAEKPAKAKGDKAKTEPADADVIEMSGEENTESGTRVAAIPVPGVDSEHEEPELGAAKANTDEPAPAVSMSAINDRPLTLGASKLEVHGGLRVNSIYFPATMGTQARTQRNEGLALGVGYGVTDTLEVGADYTVLVNPGTVKGPITFHGAYRAYVTPKLEIAAAAGFAVDFDTRLDQTTMKTSTQTYAALELGAWARYRLGRKASLFSGIPATPSSSAPITNLAFPLPPEQYQLAIGLNGGPTALDFPIGIGYQVSSSFYTLFMTDLAHVGIKSSPNAFLFKDIIPVGLGGFYVFEKVDFGLVFSDDLKKDTLRFDAVVRYPIK